MPKRNTTATLAQVEAWRRAKPGDIICVRLRSGNVSRFKVCELPAEFGSGEGQLHAQKYGQGPQSPIRRINAFEVVP